MGIRKGKANQIFQQGEQSWLKCFDHISLHNLNETGTFYKDNKRFLLRFIKTKTSQRARSLQSILIRF